MPTSVLAATRAVFGRARDRGHDDVSIPLEAVSETELTVAQRLAEVLRDAAEQAARDADEMLTWSFDGIEAWMRRNTVEAARSQAWLRRELDDLFGHH